MNLLQVSRVSNSDIGSSGLKIVSSAPKGIKSSMINIGIPKKTINMRSS